MRLMSLKPLVYIFVLIALFFFSPERLFSITGPTTQPKSTRGKVIRGTGDTQNGEVEKDELIIIPQAPRPTLITQAVALSIFALLPFFVMMFTSFLKIVIVLSLLRTALGVQQAPPNQIINGVAIMLSMYVMYPTAIEMYDAAQIAIERADTPGTLVSSETASYIVDIAYQTRGPLKGFLTRNTSKKHQALFYRMAYRIMPEEYRQELSPDDIIVVVPSYITSQLKDAFEIGVLIYIPFFVIDLVTANILLAMGMMMLSPVTISMPLKLFLLVMLDGWTILIQGLVNTYY